MQQKELRLGVVLTGGVSLVVYIHGVTKELLKLARASRAYHAREATRGEAPEAYEDTCEGREVDTERIYFELLKALGKSIDLRVVIDVIAGASAGGVNGVALARALAHDLQMDAHREMWLEHCDAIELLDRHAGRWGKIALRPLLGLALRSRLRALAPEQETRDKLTEFVRSRWFHPPFSGPRYANWLLEAFDTMERHAPEGGSLLPEGHPLDLFVSVTDFHGHTNRIPLHNPSEISERDHRQVMHFRYVRRADGGTGSDFEHDDVPGLVFAARATSCFPGAFPPARISEIDRIVARAKREWPGRQRFVQEKLGNPQAEGRELADVFLIDGSVVNNKPFGEAIAAIASRPAYRAVTRRVLYVEPTPAVQGDAEDAGEPGFFRTILSALAEIPRNEPIHDDLERVNAFNRHTRLVAQVIDRTQPMVDSFVDAVLPAGREMHKPTASEIAQWRAAANQKAADEAGYAFESYFRLKVLRVAERLGALAAGLAGSLQRDLTAQVLSDCGLDEETADIRNREIAFLKSYDVDFRIRRLRFVVRRLNMLYRVARREDAERDWTGRLDELKTTLYALIEDARRCWHPELHARVAARRRVGDEETAIGEVLQQIAVTMDLERLDGDIDEVFSVMVLNYMPAPLQRDLFSAFLGFSFFDVMSLPLMQWDGFDELEEVLIDRISPVDAVTIRPAAAASVLRGTAMRKFAGFFNRAYRENDYLWGRLNAADRLVDIVMGAVEETELVHGIDTADLKRRLFAAVLDAEAPYLKADATLIEALRDEIAMLG